MSYPELAPSWTFHTTDYPDNYTLHFTPNATDPCMRTNPGLLPPLNYSGTSYVAIGPISNFSSIFQSCCPNKTADAIQNYNGGLNRAKAPWYDAPAECFYYCSFNGTNRDIKAAVNCTIQKADENGDLGRGLWAGPAQPMESGGLRIGARIGMWKWAVLGLVIIGGAGL